MRFDGLYLYKINTVSLMVYNFVLLMNSFLELCYFRVKVFLHGLKFCVKLLSMFLDRGSNVPVNLVRSNRNLGFLNYCAPTLGLNVTAPKISLKWIGILHLVSNECQIFIDLVYLGAVVVLYIVNFLILLSTVLSYVFCKVNNKLIKLIFLALLSII